LAKASHSGTLSRTASVADANMGTAMITIARLAVAASIVFAMAGPVMAQDASRATPGDAPARGAAGARDKDAVAGERKDQGKSETEGNSDAPQANPGGCPYIKRKLELIV
jgi:hypothetical protein